MLAEFQRSTPGPARSPRSPCPVSGAALAAVALVLAPALALTLTCARAASAEPPAQANLQSAYSQPEYQRKVRAQLTAVDTKIHRGPFHADWGSLSAYRSPDWFSDAKFGIFLHWGLYSVPAFANEWYSRNMYVKGSAAYEYHRAVYGPQAKFGYKDFVPLFTAAKFDPKAWVDLFVRAGARYVVPVAEHCDGFAMYDSQFTSWDAAQMGPKRDVVGELEKATRARGLHFGVSSHRAEHWWWYHEGTQYDSDVNDARNAGIYGPAAPRTLPADPIATEPNPSHLERWLPPSNAFLDDWLARSTELVDKYHPDFIYFDWWINQPAFAPYLQRMAAYYYDESAARKQGPVLTYKQEAFPPAAAVLDIERGKLDVPRLQPWQSDTSVSIKSWGYVKDDEYRTAGSLLADLIDVVSKNGNLLLNVGPQSDGTIAPEIQSVLVRMGTWLQTNGEAIYGTRPWVLYGEGPTNAPTGREEVNRSYTPADLRFTSKGDVLYALGLAWPQDGQVLIKTLYSGTVYLPGAIERVTLFGSAESVHWEQTAVGLKVQLPSIHDDLPYALKIEARK
jgi:alpha-L-fucosidase